LLECLHANGCAQDDLSKRFGAIEQNIERLDEEVKKAGDIALQAKADGEALIPKIGVLLVCMQELKDWVIAKELDAQNSMM